MRWTDAGAMELSTYDEGGTLYAIAYSGAYLIFATVLISEGTEVGGEDRRFDHGVLIEVLEAVNAGPRVLVRGVARDVWSVARWLDDEPYPRAIGAVSGRDRVEGTERFDVASAMSLLAQSAVSLRALIAERTGMAGPASTAPLGRVAAGRWWDEGVTSDQLWGALWTVAGAVPCGPFDRYGLLTPGTLPERVRRLRGVIEHVDEVARFRFG
ncbi:MAG: hypothetical protein ACO3RB_07250 [Ilumatobacteraceae bacterium]